MQQVRVGRTPPKLRRLGGCWGSGNAAPHPAEADQQKEGQMATQEFRTDVTKTRKDGSRGALRIGAGSTSQLRVA